MFALVPDEAQRDLPARHAIPVICEEVPMDTELCNTYEERVEVIGDKKIRVRVRLFADQVKLMAKTVESFVRNPLLQERDDWRWCITLAAHEALMAQVDEMPFRSAYLECPCVIIKACDASRLFHLWCNSIKDYRRLPYRLNNINDTYYFNIAVAILAKHNVSKILLYKWPRDCTLPGGAVPFVDDPHTNTTVANRWAKRIAIWCAGQKRIRKLLMGWA